MGLLDQPLVLEMEFREFIPRNPLGTADIRKTWFNALGGGRRSGGARLTEFDKYVSYLSLLAVRRFSETNGADADAFSRSLDLGFRSRRHLIG